MFVARTSVDNIDRRPVVAVLPFKMQGDLLARKYLLQIAQLNIISVWNEREYDVINLEHFSHAVATVNVDEYRL